MGLVLRDVGDWARRRKAFAALIVVLALGLGVLIGAAVSGRVAARPSTGPGAAGAMLSVPDPVRLSSTFAAIVAEVEPAVVNISTTQLIERPRIRRHPGAQNNPFGDFFNHFFSNPNEPEAEQSLGSGVILSSKGYILTNQHVIAGATKIEVTLASSPTKYPARLIGQDTETDLAVIKINAGHPLPVAQMGNSNSAEVGDWVLAFGSPFELQGTVTSGIISAMNRNNVGQSQRQLQHFIQTDAAINPGNSGGPLVNMAGQVIGINTAIYTGGNSFEGIGFALPSNTAINVYNQLVSKGHVTRGSIGITFTAQQRENPLTLKMLGASHGIIIEMVSPGSPAAKAGIRAGDVVFSVNGKPVYTGDELVDPILRTPIGQHVEIGYIRDGKRYETAVVVANRDELFPSLADPETSAQPTPTMGKSINQDLGLKLDTLTPELVAQLKRPPVRWMRSPNRGVIVRSVEPTSFADETGFDPGDVIVEVNHVQVYTVPEFQHELAKIKPGQDVLFKILRRQDANENLTVFLAGVMPEGK
jgi:serine protease Do